MTDALDDYLIPGWPAPQSVGAAVSTRSGGASTGAYATNNLALHVGDDDAAVEANRNGMARQLDWPNDPQWLEQIHGTKVIRARADGRVRTADASYTRESGLPCAVLTADCLPVLLCDKAGTQVAAVHAGWRGLAGGVVGEAVKTFKAGPDQLMAWLGPAISAEHFEVGIDVVEAFLGSAGSDAHFDAVSEAFRPGQRPMRFYADLYALARAALGELGVTDVYGGGYCTYADSKRFYSYRRDGKHTGRMASAIWLR